MKNVNFINSRGQIGKAIHFIEQEQLLDTKLWKDCVNVFRGNCDDADHGWRGEYWGKMLRGAALVYSTNHNPKLYDTMTETIEELLEIEEQKPVISTYSSEKQYSGWDMWGRKYVMLGLEYFLEICENQELYQKIVCFLMRQAEIIMEHIGDGIGQIPITKTSDIHGGMNSVSILEPFVKLYGITDDSRIKAFATYIIRTGGCDSEDIFENAFQNEKYPYEYKEKKAYEMMSCFEGLLEYYKLIREPKILQTVENFIEKMASSEETVIGCLGCDTEYLDCARETQTAFKDDVMQETCVTVTWMKLCYKVYQVTGNEKYIGYINRSFYNAMYGAINYAKLPIQLYLQEGRIYMPIDSYSPLVQRSRRSLIAGGKWVTSELLCGCCCAIASAGIGIAGQLLMLEDEKGFVFNLYEQAEGVGVTPQGQQLCVKEETAYPKDGKVKFTVCLEKPEEFRLKFYIPEYAKLKGLTINKKMIPVEEKNHYICVERMWNTDDEIELDMDYAFVSKQCNGKVSYQYGPFVLATDSSLTMTDVEIENAVWMVGEKTFDKAHFINGYESTCCFVSDGEVYMDYASAGQNPKEDNSLVSVWF